MVESCKNLLQVGFYTVTLVLPANLAVLAIVHVALLAITKIVKTDRTHEEAQKKQCVFALSITKMRVCTHEMTKRRLLSLCK